MQAQSYFQLISPLIFLVFSCGFVVLWQFAREIVALRILALSYFLGACGLIGDFLRPMMPPDTAVFIINPFYIATAASFCAALFVFYRGRAPWGVLGTMAGTILALMCLFLFAVNDISSRTLVMNAGGFAMFSYTAWALRREMARKVDRILQVLVFLNGLQLLLRTVFVIWLEGSTLTGENYAGSVAAMSFHLSISFAALAIAVNLFVMFGMEIVASITETSHTDHLTGVLNRRGFDVRIAEMLAAPGNGGRGHAVVVADIDRFKSINDRHGHVAGDRVITRLSRLLSGTARDCDIVARWGGEEFLVVIAGGDAAVGRLYAETVRTAFESLCHDCLEGDRATVSFGVADWRPGQLVAEVAHQADMALFAAKRAGRNRVFMHPQTQAAPCLASATA